jgi:hypothetical protein
MPWRVEILGEAVVAELAALPQEMQARLSGLQIGSHLPACKVSASRTYSTWRASYGKCV